jgi:ankyrin repeat protein
LQAASITGDFEIVKLLLDNHADVNVRGDMKTPFYLDIATNSVDSRRSVGNSAPGGMQNYEC